MELCFILKLYGYYKYGGFYIAENAVKDWFLGFVQYEKPMGRLNYFLSNFAVNIMIAIIVAIIFAVFKLDYKTDFLFINILIGIPWAYIRFVLMARRWWHIAEDQTEGAKRAGITILINLLASFKFVKILSIVALVIELILIFKLGNAVEEEETETTNY